MTDIDPTRVNRRELLARGASLAVTGGLIAPAATGLIFPAAAHAELTGNVPGEPSTVLFFNGGLWPQGAPSTFGGINDSVDPNAPLHPDSVAADYYFDSEGKHARYAVTVKTGLARFGTRSLRFEARWPECEPGGRFHREAYMIGNQAEGGTIPNAFAGLANSGEAGGSVRWYSFSLYIPGSQDGASNWIPENREVFPAQFHCKAGLTPLAFFRIYGNRLEWHCRMAQRGGFDPTKANGTGNGGYLIGALDGSGGVKGRWIDLTVKMKWSENSDGLYDLYVNNDTSPRRSYRGPTCGPNGGSEDNQQGRIGFFVGAYAAEWGPQANPANPTNPPVQKKRVLLIDEVRIGNKDATIGQMRPHA